MVNLKNGLGTKGLSLPGLGKRNLHLGKKEKFKLSTFKNNNSKKKGCNRKEK